MVNKEAGTEASEATGEPNIDGAYKVALVYAAWAVATIVALVIFSFTAKSLATSDAWGHAVFVAVFAFVLPLRLRAVRENPTPRGVRAGIVIATVLLAVNVVEALLPVFPGWMRGEMTAIVFMMIAIVAMLRGTSLRGTSLRGTSLRGTSGRPRARD
ncbi:MAG: hypothetical protein J2P25_11205 [Nocardiopsaceae bacterium]|nr:hypothetical protein [Nocardiopsaceae bacterium]